MTNIPAPGRLRATTRFLADADQIQGKRSDDLVDLRELDATEATDSTALIQSAIDAGGCLIPRGTWRLDGMLILGPGQRLRLAHGATLYRPEGASSTDPLVWVNGSGAHLSGADNHSMLKTYKPCPKGIVRLGYEDATTQNPARTIARSTISGLRLEGVNYRGQSAGDPDVCIYAPSRQVADPSYVNYFHRIRNVVLINANHGIWLHGYSNGFFLSAIEGAGLRDTLIYLHGALDNTIAGTFVDSCPDIDIIRLEDVTLGGETYVPSYNIGVGIAGEPGGLNAATIRADSNFTGNGNYFAAMMNTNQGNPVTAAFHLTNQIVTGSGVDTGYIRAHGPVRLGGLLTHTERLIPRVGQDPLDPGAEQWSSRKQWVCTGLVENGSYSVFRFAFSSAAIMGGTVRLRGWMQGGNGVQNCAISGDWTFDKSINGTQPTMTATSTLRNCSAPVVTGTTVDLIVAVPNNGTAQAVTAWLDLEICGNGIPNASVATYRDTAVAQ